VFHYCEIKGCDAMLLGMSYWVLTLDDARTVAVCRGCKRKIDAARKLA
jgi:hypothetical protein